MSNSDSLSQLTKKPHVRYNKLTGEWVLVSPHRTMRPWQGKVEDEPSIESMDGKSEPNPLCPGVMRNGIQNPMYTSTYVFDNDFPALMPEPGADVNAGGNPLGLESTGDSLFLAHPVSGRCRVMCYHPDSKKVMPLMTVSEIEDIIDCWISEVRSLQSDYEWVQLFENKGEMMGCSNSHPHCQIWASSFLPNEPRREDVQQKRYYEQHKRVLLHDYLEQELRVPQEESRIVIQNEDWVVLVPFWAIWPFETLLLPKNSSIHSLLQVSSDEKRNLAHIMKSLTTIYDNLFRTNFPYSMGFHGAPGDGTADHWLLHVHYYPPLLRSATIRKFMVGFELLAQAQRDLTPETAAQRLRSVSHTTHYTQEA